MVWPLRSVNATGPPALITLGDCAAKVLGYKRIAIIADDFAYGHECVGGFQRVFEDAGGKVVRIVQKAGVDGRLFGSVTNHDIAESLKRIGFDVVKSQVRMPAGPIRMVGEHHLSVHLHADVETKVKVIVAPEA